MQLAEKFKQLSWSAIFAGSLVSVGLNFLCNLFIFSMGITIYRYIDDNVSLSILGILTIAFAAILSMFSGGWIAGKLSKKDLGKPIWGILPGFLSWSICLIITVILITNLIQFTAFHANFTSNPNFVAIKIARNAPMTTETKKANEPLPNDLGKEKEPKVIVINATITFLLFFTGALSSSLGGYLGYRKLTKDMDRTCIS